MNEKSFKGPHKPDYPDTASVTNKNVLMENNPAYSAIASVTKKKVLWEQTTYLTLPQQQC
jgi:hypothetical protein